MTKTVHRGCNRARIILTRLALKPEADALIRCLEDGADEFFLKPVRLSDVNKLRPYLLKGRSREKHPGMEEGCRLPSRIPSDLSRVKEPNPCSWKLIRNFRIVGLMCYILHMLFFHVPNFSKILPLIPCSLSPLINMHKKVGSDILYFVMYHPNRNLAGCLCLFYFQKHISGNNFYPPIFVSMYFDSVFSYALPPNVFEGPLTG